MMCFSVTSYLPLVQVGESDSVIIITHEPNWLLDWYWGDSTGTNVAYLIREYLRGRCKLRMAGDLHHYMRHSCVESKEPVHVQHLLVNGCGGAFLHPTHVFENFNVFYGNKYETKSTYPSCTDSSKVKTIHFLCYSSSLHVMMFEWIVLSCDFSSLFHSLDCAW